MPRTIVIPLAAIVALLIAGLTYFVVAQPVQVLPRIRLAPAFSFVDQDGERLTSEDLRGSFALYGFSYTSCSSPCGEIDTTMRTIQDRLGEIDVDDIPVRLITISIDPVHDTPERLAAHAHDIGADPTIWSFATTTDTELLKTIVGSGFGAYYEAKDDGTIHFDPKFVLVDGAGTIRGEYRYLLQPPDPDRILRHIGDLAEEVRNAEGAAAVAYEAAHLFLCYAP
jgi:protein SCO1/2